MAWVEFQTEKAGDFHVARVENPEDKPVKDVRVRGVDPLRPNVVYSITPVDVEYQMVGPSGGPRVELTFRMPTEGEVAL